MKVPIKLDEQTEVLYDTRTDEVIWRDMWEEREKVVRVKVEDILRTRDRIRSVKP